jgi:hypothetical protein
MVVETGCGRDKSEVILIMINVIVMMMVAVLDERVCVCFDLKVIMEFPAT